jgi:hypothetical protein
VPYRPENFADWRAGNLTFCDSLRGGSMIYHDDNGASLQPQDAERDGALDFTRTALTWFAVAALVAVLASCGAKAVLA